MKRKLAMVLTTVLCVVASVASVASDNLTRSLVVAHDVPAGFGIDRLSQQEEPSVSADDGQVVVKRRAPRALRPTKRIKFTEADGTPEGKFMFQLEKSMMKERFNIRDDNPWVLVEADGNVRVKRKWDYEELGSKKTIDFWVTITNTEGGGMSYHLNLTATFIRRPLIGGATSVFQY